MHYVGSSNIMPNISTSNFSISTPGITLKWTPLYLLYPLKGSYQYVRVVVCTLKVAICTFMVLLCTL